MKAHPPEKGKPIMDWEFSVSVNLSGKELKKGLRRGLEKLKKWIGRS